MEKLLKSDPFPGLEIDSNPQDSPEMSNVTPPTAPFHQGANFKDFMVAPNGRIFYPCRYCNRLFAAKKTRKKHIRTCPSKTYILTVADGYKKPENLNSGTGNGGCAPPIKLTIRRSPSEQGKPPKFTVSNSLAPQRTEIVRKQEKLVQSRNFATFLTHVKNYCVSKHTRSNYKKTCPRNTGNDWEKSREKCSFSIKTNTVENQTKNELFTVPGGPDEAPKTETTNTEDNGGQFYPRKRLSLLSSLKSKKNSSNPVIVENVVPLKSLPQPQKSPKIEPEIITKVEEPKMSCERKSKSTATTKITKIFQTLPKRRKQNPTKEEMLEIPQKKSRKRATQLEMLILATPVHLATIKMAGKRRAGKLAEKPDIEFKKSAKSRNRKKTPKSLEMSSSNNVIKQELELPTPEKSPDFQITGAGLPTVNNNNSTANGSSSLKIENKCPHCKKENENPLELWRHVRQCGGANTFPPRVVMAMSDVRKLYQTEDRSSCPVCQKPLKTTYKSTLIKHLYTHTKESIFQCWICGQNFRRKDHRNAHAKRHKQNEIMKTEKET